MDQEQTSTNIEVAESIRGAFWGRFTIESLRAFSGSVFRDVFLTQWPWPPKAYPKTPLTCHGGCFSATLPRYAARTITDLATSPKPKKQSPFLSRPIRKVQRRENPRQGKKLTIKKILSQFEEIKTFRSVVYFFASHTQKLVETFLFNLFCSFQTL